MNHHLVLISLSKPNKNLADKIIANLKTIGGNTAAPIWIDSAYIGIPIASTQTAADIWKVAVAGINETTDLRNLLIVELGRDWLARNETPAQNWLATHVNRDHTPV